MSNLTPVSSFDDVVQLESTDKAAADVINKPLQNLTNRTEYLKETLTIISTDIEALKAEATAKWVLLNDLSVKVAAIQAQLG